MKKVFSVFVVFLFIVTCLFTGCQKTDDDVVNEGALKVVLILNGTLGDKSFFDSADNGMKLIKKKYGKDVKVKTIEMSYDKTKWEPTLLDVSEADWDIIICGTWEMVEPLQDIAPDYPDKRYIIFDTKIDFSGNNLGNVYSIVYKQNDASFVAGALAARITTSKMALANPEKIVGFLGGMDTPIINDFLIGYIEGVNYIDPEVRVAVSYIGSFDDSAKGKEMSLAQYSLGADIGYNVAGQAGLGQLDAAKEVNRYAIGVDSDQAAIFKDSDPDKAELIATSVLKRVDNSLLRAIELHLDNKALYGKVEVLGFSEKSVGFAVNDIYKRVVPIDIRDEMDIIEKRIIKGEITVSSAFGMSSDDLNKIRNNAKP